jgi:putative intracellular protease/amidase
LIIHFPESHFELETKMQTPSRASFVFRKTIAANAFILATAIAATALSWAPMVYAAEQQEAPSSLSQTPTSSAPQATPIAPYRVRFGRSQPVVAIIGENGGTELTDFVIPFAVISRSGSAEVVTVSTQPGILNMKPALRIQPQTSIAEFDARFPDGADYLIVPAVSKSDDKALVAWVAEQGAKGGTIVSICDGALVVANSGLMKGHRATAHWATEEHRRMMYPDIQWESNVRYVADGKIVSSAGISAAIPTSLALVEVIAGHARAAELAKELGVTDWSSAHNSDVFQPHFGVNLLAHATRFTNTWFHSNESIGVPVTSGVDDIALALTVDAYSRTSRSRAFAIASTIDPVQTRSGLMFVPDRLIDGNNPPDYVLPAFDSTPSAQVFDKVLVAIGDRYGRSTAYRVALDFEYPDFKK